jgi:site-specific recombinase XerD
MLRNACGYALANRGHDTRALQTYVGHRYIQHTVRYTEVADAVQEFLAGVTTTTLAFRFARELLGR